MYSKTKNFHNISSAKKVIYNVMLFSMLHSSFVAPIQGIIDAYLNKEQGLHYKGSSLPAIEDETIDNNQNNSVIQKKQIQKTIKYSEPDFSNRNKQIILSDIKEGIIGISKEVPLDDPKDNIFKFLVENEIRSESKVFLTYELFGVQDANSISKSINDRFASGGHMVKYQNGWSTQKEEIDARWLKAGINRIMFSLPKNANYQFRVKNMKIEIEQQKPGTVDHLLVISNPYTSYIKNNELYVKGFLRNASNTSKIYLEDKQVSMKDGEFEGFLTLTDLLKKRNFLVIKAVDSNGLVGQEILSLDNLLEADRVFPMEESPETNISFFKANASGKLAIDGASLFMKDSALAVDKSISITKLRTVDMAPLASGMINVTKGGNGFRFLPDGTIFQKPIQLSIGYDEKLIPNGYGPKDIKTYYFNTDSKNWIAIERDSIIENAKTIVSYTNHFTDYINGIIQSPESSETAGFTPTMMNDIKAADPSSEITLIAPPEPSQNGAAAISYPIKIPAGRMGMQPNLAIQYSNEGSNGWLGLGWNLTTPAITIDTRWGVPNFDPSKESEIYTLGGEQLMYPRFEGSDWMPNRHHDDGNFISTEPQPRTHELLNNRKLFTPRKQGSFAKIERIGNTTSSYYWKVTDTNGTVSWYGGDENGITNSAVIRQTPGGNIVHWALRKTIDVFGNNIIYDYTTVTFANGEENNTNLNGGIIFNVSAIHYTGQASTTGNYHIQFVKESTIFRKDLNIDARLGIKQIDPYRLTSIIVKYQQQNIRTYTLAYKNGEFDKSLLDYVVEKDANGVEFYRHQFTYYNDVRKTETEIMKLFDKPVTIDLPNLQNPSFTLGAGNFIGYSRLNTNESIEAGWEVRPAGGLEVRFKRCSSNPSKTITFGLPFGESFPKDKGIITMTDIDGNGLDDIIYKTNSGLKYYPYLFNTETNAFEFGDQKSISGVTNFSRTEGKSKTMFLESWDIRFKLRKKLFYYGKKRFRSQSENNIYFTDGNGDGLLDIVKDNIVLFNRVDPGTGNLTFNNSSEGTPNMVITASVSEIETETHPEPDNLNDPQGFDVVRVWIAPKAGRIAINDQIGLTAIDNNSFAYYSIETAINNGTPFRVYLQQLTNSSPSATVALTNYSGNNPDLGFPSGGLLEVTKGQKFFFRVNKNAGDNNSEVESNPIISYINETLPYALTDENLLDHNASSYQDGFILSADQGFRMNYPGEVTINWEPVVFGNINATTTPPSDNVTYQIIKEVISDDNESTEIIYSKTCVAGASTDVSPDSNQIPGGHDFNNTLFIDFDAGKGDYVNLRFVVFSDSNLKWKSLQWKPSVFYEYTPDSSYYPEGLTNLTITRYPVAEYSIYKSNFSRKFEPNPNWITPSSYTTYGIKPRTGSLLDPTDNGSFIMVVKRGGQLIGKRTIEINSGVVTFNNNPINFDGSFINNPAYHFLYTVGFYTKNNLEEALFKKYQLACSGNTAVMGYDWNSTNPQHFLPLNAASYFNEFPHLGSMHREWGQFFYNDEMDHNVSIPADNINKLINPAAIDNFFSNINIDAGFNEDSDCYQLGSDEEIEDCLGDENLDNLFESDPNNPIIIPEEITEQNIDSQELENLHNLSIFNTIESPFMMGNVLRDYKTINNNEIEIERWIGIFDTQYTQETVLKSGSFAGSAYDTVFVDDDGPQTIETQNAFRGMYAINKKMISASKSKTAGWGIFNLNKSSSSYSSTVTDFMDFNGDRYPDIINSSQLQMTNMTGGLFSSPLPHSYGRVIENSSNGIRLTINGGAQILGREAVKDNTAGTGKGERVPTGARSAKKADMGNTSFQMGIGLDANLSGVNRENNFWVDLNGDGLADRIITDPNQGMFYQINKGKPSSGVYENFPLLETTQTHPKSLGVNINISLDVENLFDSVNLPLDINLSAGMSNSGATTSTTMQDINGDGLVDLLYVDGGAQQGVVHFNTGNAFKQATNPLTIDTSLISLVGNSNTTSLSVSGAASYFKGFSICCWFLPILHIKAGITASGNANLSISNAQKMFKDMNGDGYADYVEKVGGDLKVYYSKVGRTNMLESVINPLGGSFVVDYSSNPVSFNNPHAKWVMKSIEMIDNHGEDVSNSYFKKISYSNAKYDRRERQFYGFETVKVEDVASIDGSTYRTSIMKYHNNSYFLNGLLKESLVIKGDDETQIFSKSESKYEIKKLDPTTGLIDQISASLLPTFDVGGSEGRKSAAVLLTETNSYLYELGTAPIHSRTTMTYNGYGNVTVYNYLGDITFATDNYSSEIVYHDETTAPGLMAKNIIGVAKSIIVKDNNGLIKRKRTTSNITANGQIGKITSFYTSPSNATDVLNTNLEYFSNGNLKKVTNPSGMFYEYQYDPEGKYIVQTTDAFGFVSTASYNAKFDKIEETIDLSGNKMRFQYDSFSRLTKVFGPKELQLGGSQWTIRFNYFPKLSDTSILSNSSCFEDIDFTAFAITEHYDPFHPTNAIETITFMDGLSRVVQVKKDIEMNENPIASENPVYVERMSVSGKSVYDAYGRATHQYHPIYENKSSCQNYLWNLGDSGIFSHTDYDELDRPIVNTDPEENESSMLYEVDGGFIKTTATVQNDNNQVVTETYKDASGRVVSTKNLSSLGDILTEFKYNSIGELISYTDAAGISTTYKYDLLGRKVTITHPDNGQTKFEYNNAGNLVRLITANLAAVGESISYKYDYNRIKEIIYPNIANNANVANVIYKYGNPSATNPNDRGRLIEQSDATGYQTFSYGIMGEMVENVRTVVSPAPNMPTRVFKTIFEYDSWNRMKYLQYPDGEKVAFKYDLGGNLKSMTGDQNNAPYDYIKRIDYDHYEQRTYLKYGNGTETAYTYSSGLRRLSKLNVKTANQQDLFNNSYGYDKVGNVLNIENDATPNATLGGKYIHKFGYDDLNRLNKADGNFEGESPQSNPGNDVVAKYGLAMQYNNVHSIMSKEQTHDKTSVVPENTYKNGYDYYPGTHQLAGTNDTNTGATVKFFYDHNGNQKKRITNDPNNSSLDATVDYFWDESNRLRVVATNTMQHYLYDANGERVLKAGSDYEAVYENGTLTSPGSIILNPYTTYASAYLVIDGYGEYTKHYFAGSQRIVSRIGDEDSTFFDEEQNAPRGTDVEKPTIDIGKLKQAQLADLQYYFDLGKKGKASFKETNKPTTEEQQRAPEPGINPCYNFPVNTQAYIDCCEQYPPGVCEGLIQIPKIYYYHPDHLGTSTFLTDANGNAYQFFLNLPFGETMAEQKSIAQDYATPYKFSGKELDAETGLYYFGARYYDPKVSYWLSVDPLAEEFPAWNPYSYTLQNPINLIDPNGMSPKPPSYYMNYRGFWTEDNSSFGSYIGNVRPLTDRYMELVEINGTLYHKNTTLPLKELWNDVFGTNLVNKKEYTTEEETNNDVIRMGSEFAITGVALKAIGGTAGTLLKGAGNSLWKIAAGPRGFVYEEMLNLAGKFKVNNYPVIDAFFKGVGTSVKTLDIYAESYLPKNAIFNQLRKYVDKLARFEGTRFAGVDTRNRITKKILEVGIPRGASEAQVNQINKAIEYAAEKGIQMNVRVVK